MTTKTIRQQLPHRTVSEIVRHTETRQHYLDFGYPYDIADQYAWDEYYAVKKGHRNEEV